MLGLKTIVCILVVFASQPCETVPDEESMATLIRAQTDFGLQRTTQCIGHCVKNPFLDQKEKNG